MVKGTISASASLNVQLAEDDTPHFVYAISSILLLKAKFIPKAYVSD